MARAALLGLAAALFLGGESGAQTQAPAPAPSPSAEKTETPRTYVPGLEVFMATVQTDHTKLWFAARAGNWPLAEYQLGELREVLGDIVDFVPAYKDLPIGQMIDAITTGPITDLEKAMESKDFKKFAAAFDKLTEACNSCHQAASRGFIVIRRPISNQFTNQVFEPAR